MAMIAETDWVAAARDIGFPAVGCIFLGFVLWKVVQWWFGKDGIWAKQSAAQIASTDRLVNEQINALASQSESYKQLTESAKTAHDGLVERNRVMAEIGTTLADSRRAADLAGENLVRAAERACDVLEDLGAKLGHDIRPGVEAIRRELRRDNT